MMAASLTLIKRPSLLPLPAKFRTLAPPPFPFHFPLPFSFISPNHYSSSPLSLDSYFSDNYTLHFSYDSEPFFASLINSSTHKTHLTQIHAQLLVLGFQASPFLITKLVNYDSNVGHITYARQVFDEFTDPGVFLWNAIVRGYSKHNAYADAVQMYCGMQEMGVGPDGFTFPGVLKACGGLGAVEMGRRVHGQVFRHGFESDVVVQNSLVAFYAKCGRVDRARIVFDGLGERSIVSWTSIISGYAQNGECLEALRIFGLMRKVNVKPDWIVLVSVLKVYTDLLGRAGQLEQAYDFIKKMPIEPGTSVWGALLSSCKIHRNVTLGQYAAEKLLSLDPYEIGHYVQLSNLFASARLWDRVAQVRVLMREKGLIKGIGHSLIEINGKLQAFHVGDKSHPRSEEIYEELESLERRLKEAGFVPHTESVLHDLNYEETEETLCNHSERLAIVYGLISTAPGTTLRITKNIRGCVNCHAATKLISKLVNREIVVRDAKRFHHFKDGFCSCGDYW